MTSADPLDSTIWEIGRIFLICGSAVTDADVRGSPDPGPLGFDWRPPGQVHFAVTCGFEAADVFIRMNGEVVVRNVPFSPDTNDVSLDGVFFCTSAR